MDFECIRHLQGADFGTAIDARLLALASFMSIQIPRCREDIYTLLANGSYTSIAIVSESGVVGGCTFSYHNQNLLLEYIAVADAGKGLGTELIKRLLALGPECIITYASHNAEAWFRRRRFQT